MSITGDANSFKKDNDDDIITLFSALILSQSKTYAKFNIKLLP